MTRAAANADPAIQPRLRRRQAVALLELGEQHEDRADPGHRDRGDDVEPPHRAEHGSSGAARSIPGDTGGMGETADAVVIGAGIIGAAVALELARGGRDVVCVDKGPAPGAGSTSASSSIIRFSYSTLDAVLTAWEAAACWRDWAAHLGVEDPDGMARFVRTGGLVYCTPGYDGAAVMALWDDVGIPYEWLDEQALAARFPALDPGATSRPSGSTTRRSPTTPAGSLTAFHDADSGYVDDPMLAAHNLAHAARHHGARFRFGEAVVAVGRADGRVAGVELGPATTIAAPVVVNVGGPHSARLNALAGVTGDMRIGHRAAAPGGVRRAGAGRVDGSRTARRSSPTSTSASTSGPRPAGRCSSAGRRPTCDELEWIDDPDHFDEAPTVEGWERSMLRLARRVPSFGVPTRPVGLAALYDASDDWVPIYDRSSLDGWFMACGTSGNQFKNAPLAGQFIRALVDAAAAGIDHDVEPVRFRGPLTGRTIDLAAFSRRRHPATTSGTVMG